MLVRFRFSCQLVGRFRRAGLLTAFVLAAPLATTALFATEPPATETAPPATVTAPLASDVAADRQRIVARAVEYLRTKGQADDGSFSKQTGPAVTALCLTALLDSGVPVTDPSIVKGLDYLKPFIHEDGGIYKEGSTHRNYETCIGMVLLVKANADGRFDPIVASADKYLKGAQWDEGEGKEPSDTFYGGAGYGGSSRPDLSNTSFFVEALRESGNDEDSEAIQRALAFVSRCQNLESEHNTTPFAAKVNDGGFYYTPAAGGSSQAGTDDEGGLRSYASMTYAGLKSMIYAGVDQNDPRVKAALTWIKKNYDLSSNPGMGDNGLFYYYNTFAKALSVMGEPKLTDEAGVVHDWRADLVAELAKRQRDDGAWVNSNARWMEGDANLSTGYALLALAQVAGEKAK